MIRFELNDSDWTTSKRYWNELKKRFTKPDDAKKAEFINRVLFKSSARNVSSQTNPPDSSTTTIATITTTTPIPSINSISEIMNEIDNEIKSNSKNDIDIINNSDIKTQELKTITTTQAQEEFENKACKELKRFIGKPVKSFFY